MREIGYKEAKSGDIVVLEEPGPIPRRGYGEGEKVEEPCVVKETGADYKEVRHPATRKFLSYFYQGARLKLLSPEEAKDVDKELIERLGAFSRLMGPVGPNNTSTGTDPEIFIMKDGEVVPSFRVLPKQEEDVTIFSDGFQAEFNIKPKWCHEEATGAVQTQLMSLYNTARELVPGATLSCADAVEIDGQVLRGCSDDEVALGCAPSTNGYEDEEPLQVPDPRDLTFRFAGCHMHFGLPEKKRQDWDYCSALARWLDRTYGVLSVSLLQGLENPIRRQFYGKAGEFRMPKWGIEYRVPSAAVLSHPVVFNLNFDLARALKGAFDQGLHEYGTWGVSEEEGRRIVNELDIKAAQTAIKDNEKEIRSILRTLYGEKDEKALRLLTEGAKNVLKDVGNVVKSWGLDGLGYRSYGPYVRNL